MPCSRPRIDRRAGAGDHQGVFDFFRALLPRLLTSAPTPPVPATPPTPAAAPALSLPPAARLPASTPEAGYDEDLTRLAADLLRGVGCHETAARVAVCWNPRLTSTAGLAKPAQSLVVLNPRLREFPDEVDRTLRHEVAHLAVAAKARGRQVAAHGPEWRGACAALGIPGESRCHTLPLPRRQQNRSHVYRCPHCRFELRRVRAIKPRTRLACRDCCRQHAGGIFDRRFEFIKISG